MKFLEITTNVGCPVDCTYCPQETFLAEYGSGKRGKRTLSLTDLDKVLAKLPNDCEIGFSGFAEPWNNEDCTEMVLRCMRKGVRITIYTTLVGMTMNDVRIMSGMSFKTFCVHLPTVNKTENIPVTSEYLEVLESVLGMTPDITYAVFGPLPVDVKNIVGDLPVTPPEHMVSRCGLVPNCGKNVVINGPVRCLSVGESEILDHNVLLPDGRVVLCCMDFGMTHVLGNLFTQTYESLFEGEEADKIRAGLRGEGTVICQYCEYGVPA